jgi:hypothetical protein
VPSDIHLTAPVVSLAPVVVAEVQASHPVVENFLTAGLTLPGTPAASVGTAAVGGLGSGPSRQVAAGLTVHAGNITLGVNLDAGAAVNGAGGILSGSGVGVQAGAGISGVRVSLDNALTGGVLLGGNPASETSHVPAAPPGVANQGAPAVVALPQARQAPTAPAGTAGASAADEAVEFRDNPAAGAAGATGPAGAVAEPSGGAGRDAGAEFARPPEMRAAPPSGRPVDTP